MNNIKPNFFIVNRGLLYSERWLSEKFTRGQAWVDLFGLAQHTESFFRVRGIKINVKRGQLAYSQLSLSKRWGWSRDKVRRYLNELESAGDIRQQNNNQTTLITILKYDLWQGDRTKQYSKQDSKQYNKQDTYKQCIKNDKKILSPNSGALIDFFIKQVKDKRHFSYKDSLIDRRVLRIALSKKTPDQIKEIIVWYLGTDKSKEHLSISSALSQHSLNLYEENVAKGSWNKI